jgi:hypothetical protein
MERSVMNKSTIGEEEARPAYIFPTFSVMVLLGDKMMAPPCLFQRLEEWDGTKKGE